MPFTLDKIFTTATAFSHLNAPIREIQPCAALKPYIRCFWETDVAPHDVALRIIPDCCADILIFLSDGKACSQFCGVCNQSFMTHGSAKMFGIRFYAWSVCLFSSVGLNGTLNGYFPADTIFNDFSTVATEINHVTSMHERVAAAQKHLLKTLRQNLENSDVMNALYLIITQSARVNVRALSDYCALSKRALERNFRTFTGMSPKEAIDTIRYQLLWQQCLQPDFNVLDGVEKFGFYDAAHLYNDFKKHHGISLPQAVTNR